MGLIFEQTSFKSRFLAQWSLYVDAVLLYAEQSSKKGVSSKLKDLDRNGMSPLSVHTPIYGCHCNRPLISVFVY